MLPVAHATTVAGSAAIASWQGAQLARCRGARRYSARAMHRIPPPPPPTQQLILQRRSAGAKGAVRSSAQAMRRRSGVAGLSSWKKPVCPALSLATYTASCTPKVTVNVNRVDSFRYQNSNA